MPEEIAINLNRAARDVIAERQRQVSAEGYSLHRDDLYVKGELAEAGATYASLAGRPRSLSTGIGTPRRPPGHHVLRGGFMQALEPKHKMFVYRRHFGELYDFWESDSRARRNAMTLMELCAPLWWSRLEDHVKDSYETLVELWNTDHPALKIQIVRVPVFG